VDLCSVNQFRSPIISAEDWPENEENAKYRFDNSFKSNRIRHFVKTVKHIMKKTVLVLFIILGLTQVDFKSQILAKSYQNLPISLRAETVRILLPNVNLIISNDLTYALSWYGRRQCRTPNLDRQASRVVQFIRAYTMNPICGLSHAAIPSGLWSCTTGTAKNYFIDKDLPDVLRDIVHDLVALPEFFQQKGYYAVRGVDVIPHRDSWGHHLSHGLFFRRQEVRGPYHQCQGAGDSPWTDDWNLNLYYYGKDGVEFYFTRNNPGEFPAHTKNQENDNIHARLMDELRTRRATLK
jgi:hypothetical protein